MILQFRAVMLETIVRMSNAVVLHNKYEDDDIDLHGGVFVDRFDFDCDHRIVVDAALDTTDGLSSGH